jgi:DNA-binding HxlR family transcriptional regulator
MQILAGRHRGAQSLCQRSAKVEYSLTSLGRSLCGLVEGICSWAEANIVQVQEAREVYNQTPREASMSQ